MSKESIRARKIREHRKFRECKFAPEIVTALERCEVAMDTAALHGVGDILPPAYRDSWAAAHEAARAALKLAKGE